MPEEVRRGHWMRSLGSGIMNSYEALCGAGSQTWPSVGTSALSLWALSPDFTSCLIRIPLHGLNKPRLLMRSWSDFSGRLFLLFLWILGFHTTSNNLWCFFFSSEYTSVSFFFNLLWQNTHKKNQFNCTVERNYLFTTLPLLLCILELFFFLSWIWNHILIKEYQGRERCSEHLDLIPSTHTVAPLCGSQPSVAPVPGSSTFV